MGQASIAVGTTTDSYELTFPEELKARMRGAGRGTRLDRHAGADRLCDLGQGARAGHGDPRLSLLASGSGSSATDQTGRVVASLDTTRHFVAPAPVPRRRAPGRPGRRSRCRPAATNTAWRSSRARKRASSCPAIRSALGGRLGHTRTERPGAREPQRQSGLAAHRRRTPSSSIRCRRSSAARRCSCTTRSRACSRARPTRCGSRCGSRVAVAGLFRKIFGGGGAAISLKFDDPGPRRCQNRPIAACSSNSLKPGMYVLEVSGDRRRAADRDERRSGPSRWSRSSGLAAQSGQALGPGVGQDQQRLHQGLGLHLGLHLDQVLGHAGAGVERGDVHQQGRQGPVQLDRPCCRRALDRRSRPQRDPGVTEQPQRRPRPAP